MNLGRRLVPYLAGLAGLGAVTGLIWAVLASVEIFPIAPP
jgi:hypothetical protein